MRHDDTQTGAKRGFWARFWESLRNSLGGACL
jgi:hypothetical protein